MIAFAEQGSSWDSAFNQRELHRQGDVALFLPFACNNGQQAEAKIDTLRKRKSTDLYCVKWAIRQPRATSRKRRLKVNPFIPIVLLWIGAFIRDRSIFF